MPALLAAVKRVSVYNTHGGIGGSTREALGRLRPRAGARRSGGGGAPRRGLRGGVLSHGGRGARRAPLARARLEGRACACGSIGATIDGRSVPSCRAIQPSDEARGQVESCPCALMREETSADEPPLASPEPSCSPVVSTPSHTPDERPSPLSSSAPESGSLQARSLFQRLRSSSGAPALADAPPSTPPLPPLPPGARPKLDARSFLVRCVDIAACLSSLSRARAELGA
jgi:hypothetical protein